MSGEERTKLRDVKIGEVFRVDYGVRPGYYMPVGDAAIYEGQALALVADVETGAISKMNCDASVIKTPSDPDWKYPGPDPERIAGKERAALSRLVPGDIFIAEGTRICYMLAVDGQIPRSPGKKIAVNLRNGQLNEISENEIVTRWPRPERNKNRPAPGTIYQLYDARPDNGCRFVGYFTAGEAMAYAEQAHGKGGEGSGDEAWIARGELRIGPGWRLKIKEMDEECAPCVPVIRKLLSEGPGYDHIAHCSEPAFPKYISRDPNISVSNDTDEVHKIMTICDSIVIKFSTAGFDPDEETMSAKGTMYLPFEGGALELAYFHEHVRHHPEKDKKYVESGPNAIKFDASGKDGAARLSRLDEYMTMLRAAGIAGPYAGI